MRQGYLQIFCCLTLLLASACGKTPWRTDVDRAVQGVSELDSGATAEMMLALAPAEEAVAYFEKALADDPKAIAPLRGLAAALTRAKDAARAVEVWQEVARHPDSTPDDQIDLADSLIRLDRWGEAEQTLAGVPAAHATFKRLRLEAIIADSKKDWQKADAFYQSAIALTETPASTLNNWGFSNISRGNHAEAERLLMRALAADPTLFTAKNNLVMARAGQKKYQLPAIDMTQQERAELLYTMALTAIKQGDVTIGKTLLREAVDAHPRYFEEAARALKVIEGA